ncbi:metallophosphoesterase [Undibacterium sp. TJN25]|uniref:metallophosphoesterase n=1 Tax=Undibacterium sp. TJN25 TaxID=3413056 RepID=UPI003BEF4FD8
MRILVLSDLHHEQWREFAPVIDPSISLPDVVVLAGDINNGSNAIKWASSTFSGLPVLYVQGNHEAYGYDMGQAESEVAAACQASDNIQLLSCSESIIAGVRFLGTTLWTDFELFGPNAQPAAMRASEDALADYRRIRKGPRYLTAEDTASVHITQKTWLDKKLDESFPGSTVVITHMAPSKSSVVKRYSEDLVSAAFASRLDKMVMRADLWIHGHMHNSSDYHIGKCRVVCNPCGYRTNDGRRENPSFNPNLIVVIE